jgi:hypothetical protein
MKKIAVVFSLFLIGLDLEGQTRVSLYEEFTGEDCQPCAATNPALDAMLALPSNTVKAQCIKWMVPIPSAPTATWSLYQTNSTEISWRNGYYGNSAAPQGSLDGQSPIVFGATSAHPYYMSSTILSNAQSIFTPFSILMNVAWDVTFSNAVVTLTVTSSTSFTANGAFKLRLVLCEKEVNFSSPPGFTAEKDFSWPVRRSYPDIQNATTLLNTWAANQSQTFTINCAAPSYITNISEMIFVAFVQDDGNKKVYQTARSSQPPIPNDAKATGILIPSVNCISSIMPQVTVYNNGINTITSLTFSPAFNSVNSPLIFSNCNLAPGASTTIPMGLENLVNGTNDYSFSITGVSGGDIVTVNNNFKTSFYNALSYSTTPIMEDFSPVLFPPEGFAVFNPFNAKWPWTKSLFAGGFGLDVRSTYLFLGAWTQANQYHDLYLPGTCFSGTITPSVKFDLSYAQLSATGNDTLKLQVSTNCGATWSTAWQNYGTSMMTAPPYPSNLFIPSASQWTSVTVPLAAYSNSPQVLLRFRAIGGSTYAGGNAIYLDNINVYDQTPTGIAENTVNENSFSVYPNPASNEINVRMESLSQTNTTIKIINTLGQVVVCKRVSLNKGVNIIPVDTKQLANDIYYISFDSENGTVTKKITVNR